MILRYLVTLLLLVFLVGCAGGQGHSYYIQPPAINPAEKIIFTNQQGIYLWEQGKAEKLVSGEGRGIFSPERKQLGYSREGQAYFYNLETNGEYQLGLGEFQAWLAQGKVALLSQLGPEEEQKLYLINLATGQKHFLGISYGALDYPNFSGDGNLMAVSEGTGKIYLWDLLQNQKVFLGLGSNPQLSPNQKKVLYYGGVGKNNLSRLGIIEITSKKELTLDNGDYASWSPDGSYLAYQKKDQIYLIRADGSGRRILGKGAKANQDPHLSWSPTGDKIAFQADGWLHLIDLGKGKSEKIKGEALLGWSWQGEKIVFQATDQIYLADFPGRNLRPLGQGLYLGWQPGGNRFLFAPHEEVCSLADNHEEQLEDLDIYLYSQLGKPVAKIGRGYFAQWLQ